MDVALLITAFGFGFAARIVGLPPLVGYLVAGFVLHGFGFETTEECCCCCSGSASS
jgi:glutathione-regulated potassium-efflux system ancillary protein KefC